jgi:geranylgeranyl diphosphate synthase type I
MSGRGLQGGGAVQRLRHASDEIDSALRAFIDRQPLKAFYDLTRHHFGWNDGGPAPLRAYGVVCTVACEACGGNLEAALPLAVSITLLHELSINQEDLERARPESRGRASVWQRWGVPQAMNAGDGMHALAKMALLEARDRLQAAAILHLEELLDECYIRLCEAIHNGLESQTRSEAAIELAACKAGILFGCAGYGGCYLAGGNQAMAERMRRFGELLGAAAGLAPIDRGHAEAKRDQALATITELPRGVRGVLTALAEHVMESGGG